MPAKKRMIDVMNYNCLMERHMHECLKEQARKLSKQYGFHVTVSDIIRKVIQNYLDAVNG